MDAESSGRRRRGDPAAFRVHHFASVTHLDNVQALTAELKMLVDRGSFARRAWVNLWDVRSSHQYLLLPAATDEELEMRAWRHGASALGMHEDSVTVATSLGGTRGEPGHHAKREVSFFAAGSNDIRARLRPIVDAGFVVEGVTTPCGALWAQSQLRRASLAGEVHAHVALGVSQSALGIFGDGRLLYARDLDWGYAAPSVGTPVALDRDLLADRLSAELRRSFLYLKQYWERDVSQVLLCGDMPEIRSLTAPMIDRLNIEVETLDTLEGIDATAIPDGFAERAATFRLASSIAVAPPPVNLLPVEVSESRTNAIAIRMFAAGSAAAVVFGAFLYGQASASRLAAEHQLEVVRREIASMRPRAANASAGRATPENENIQRAALRALDVQGPVMARVLEAAANAVPQGVTLRSLRALPEGDRWNVTFEAFAAGRDQAARDAAGRVLRALAGSPIFDGPVGSATRRMAASSDGIEIAAAYRVRKSQAP